VLLRFALVPTAALTWRALGYISGKTTRQVEELHFEHAGMRADALLGRLIVGTLFAEWMNYLERSAALGT
jgi:hypothetical protein